MVNEHKTKIGRCDGGKYSNKNEVRDKVVVSGAPTHPILQLSHVEDV